jgi:Family of unknown function (DUF6335)
MAKKAVKRRAGGSARKGSRKRQKAAPRKKRAGSGARASARSRAAASRRKKAARKTGRRAAAARAPRKAARAKKRSVTKRRASTKPRTGGTGREEELDQTPQTGRTVQGPTNPMPTRRSTGTASGAGSTRRAPGLERARKQLREIEETIPGPPSSLGLDRRPSAARSGRHELAETRREHNEVSPDLTAGDVDADWEDAYSVGDEAPGGDNPTPDQDRVDDIGKALGVQYEDNEELKAADKIAERDKHRWELDPASSDDYKDRD